MDLPKSDKSQSEQDELRQLREENARLKKLLTQHGIALEDPATPEPVPAPNESAPVPTHFTTDDKIALFRRLFRGREDVYPQRWESAKGTSGYSPACGNEWKPGICHKPRVKCGDCKQRQLLPLANRLIRLAAFQNPEFYKSQAMRLPVWNKPRIIGCAENFPQHIGLPRGCLDTVLDLLQENDIRPELQDERLAGRKVTAKFTGTLRKDQKSAVREMLKHEVGVLCAPTAFGKTVTAAALIARRKVSTLVLVHRTELLRQWQERLIGFLESPKGSLGVIGGGKKKQSGKIDIAVMQSLSRREDLGELLDQYGQIIIDECHHLSAFSFEAILKQAKAKFIVGLTATPIRRDGHQPIIFMQCGPIRHSAARPETAPAQLEVWPKVLPAPEIPPDSPIQDVFRILANDAPRNHRIVGDVLAAYREGRKVLVLTERTDHLPLLREALGDEVEHCFVLHGRLSKKQRTAVFEELETLDESAPRVLLATGRLIGEGFDHPPLDTLVLAMPISWKGTLQQYAGRLHREHADKQDVRIYDYAETDQPQLNRMWDKRQRGYRAMGYEIKPMETIILGSATNLK